MEISFETLYVVSLAFRVMFEHLHYWNFEEQHSIMNYLNIGLNLLFKVNDLLDQILWGGQVKYLVSWFWTKIIKNAFFIWNSYFQVYDFVFFIRTNQIKMGPFFCVINMANSGFSHLFSFFRSTFFPANGQLFYSALLEWNRSYLQPITHIGSNLNILVQSLSFQSFFKRTKYMKILRW